MGWVLALSACNGAATTPEPRVRPGIDVLLADSAHLLTGHRVGLLTSQTGIDAAGTSDVERLLAAGVNLVALFSPEHGYRGVLDQPTVGHGIDSVTGLPIYSLYGEVRAPTLEMLRGKGPAGQGHAPGQGAWQGVDLILVDLQDIGARTYTFVSTTLLTLEAAGRAGVPVIVLDRPNPVGGELVQGPVLDPAFASFVGMLPIPLRHGMTYGELALFGRDVLGFQADLTVVPVGGWSRSQWFDATGLPWVQPSPSMPSLESASHYPGLVLFEATNLSVGRGTAVAFQVIAAPWLDPGAVLAVVGPLPGADARDTTVTPVAPPDDKYPGLRLPAIRLSVRDRTVYDPTATAVRLLAAVRRVHADSLVIRPAVFDERAGSDGLRTDLEAGTDVESIVAGWRPGVVAFLRAREPFLLYR